MQHTLESSTLCFACAEPVSEVAIRCSACGTRFDTVPSPVLTLPLWMRVVGGVHVLLGAVGVLSALVAMATMPSVASSLSQWGMSVGALTFFVLLVAAGVGLVRARPWARPAGMAWSLFAMGWTATWWLDLLLAQNSWIVLLESDPVTASKAVVWSLTGSYALVAFLGLLAWNRTENSPVQGTEEDL